MAKLDTKKEPIVEVSGLTVRFGSHTVLEELSLDVMRGEILGVVGGSGSGKSVLMRTIIGLLPQQAGAIKVFGCDLNDLSENELRLIERRWGVMFQRGALFSSLTVRQNIQFQMREILNLSDAMNEEMAMAKLEMVGLSHSDANKMPSELSGGMTKRVALARALALDAEFVFLDEPTSGLDPISAGEFDDLIKTLQTTLGLTVFLVTHDLQSLHRITDRIAVVAEGKIIAKGPIPEMMRNDYPWVKSYFQGRRGNIIAGKRPVSLGDRDGI